MFHVHSKDFCNSAFCIFDNPLLTSICVSFGFQGLVMLVCFISSHQRLGIKRTTGFHKTSYGMKIHLRSYTLVANITLIDYHDYVLMKLLWKSSMGNVIIQRSMDLFSRTHSLVPPWLWERTMRNFSTWRRWTQTAGGSRKASYPIWRWEY